MRQILLVFSLFCASYITVNAQTNTWTGAGANTNWNTVANWSLNAVPTAAHDVVIPTGFNVIINVAATTKSIVVQGNATLNIASNLSFVNASSFTENVTVNWSNSNLTGGGTLTNNGTVNLLSTGSRYITNATTIVNNGLFTMPDGGYLYLYDTSIFNNTAEGVFDIQSNGVIYRNGDEHSFNNDGLLKKTGADNNSQIQCRLTNSGIISVEDGTLTLNGSVKTFNSGVYNVATDSGLILETQINSSGTFTGVLNGALIWSNNLSVEDAVTFNFTGTSGVQWRGNSLIGGGTLTNMSRIDLSLSGSRYISDGTTLNNQGLVTMPSGGYLYLYDTSVFNNTSSGVFDFQSDGVIYRNGESHSFNNVGLLKKTGGSGNSQIQCKLANSGTISVESGTLTLNGSIKTFNSGVYNVISNSQLILGTQIDVSGTLSGVLDGALTWSNDISVASTATFNFTGETGVHWTARNLIGGGTLTNASTITLATSGSRYIVNGTTLNNQGLMTMPSGGYLYLYGTSVFNNTSSGVFDFQSDGVIYRDGESHSFNNVGLLKKTGGSGNSQIQCKLTNSGTISVESGTLTLNGSIKTFNSGVYNVVPNSQLILGTQIDVSGTLSGVLDGALTWISDMSVANAATFNFTGSTGVNWNSNSLIGGGTLTNASKINLAGSGSRYITGTITTLVNSGTITMPSGGYLYLYHDTTLDNQASGVIDIQSDAQIYSNGNGALSINNAGLFKKSLGNGTSNVHPPITNSGVIEANSGTLNFQNGVNFNNTINGIVKGTANIDIPLTATFTNDGTFAPGGSPGTLTVLGDYKSSDTSVLDVELNGLVQGTEYDLLSITGTNVVFDGDVNVTMGFDAAVGNSFTIATVSGTIATKSLTTPLTADYDGFRYTFDVTYPNDKAVRLTISSRVDIQPPTVITQDVTLQLNASGNATLTASQVNNGSSDNGTSSANLVYELSKTNFNCGDLGSNTVTLTVTDEAGNSASAPATITVEDVTAPTVTCPADQTVEVNAVEYILPDYLATGGLTVSDNCSFTVVQSPVAGTELTHGVHSITFAVTDAGGNEGTCSFDLTVNDLSLGIEDHELNDSAVLLYPNPVHHILTIENVGHLELLSADIVDITGKTMSTINLEHMGLTKEVSLESYASGIYFMKIKGKTGMLTKRIIKE
ncbi:HYR domain-containing protein [Gelidibacter maritimus]|uniref:HYR domain-containing protein n=1 Tax=Gelidibacter maritimus TaxID=2761487 RepID=A0A7W2M3N0_9FLAO|nr:HYR domain-containing protein [Gelidibacter maritimus]MBA6152057.1 HYR domain-containing protein [Gelidibacter maritimus]